MLKMKTQWIIVCGLILALLTASVAVFNVERVTLNYITGQAEVSLIVVISGSILLGGIIVALFGMLQPYFYRKERDRMHAQYKQLTQENANLKLKLDKAETDYSLVLKEQEQQTFNEKTPPTNNESNTTLDSEESKDKH